VIPIFLAKNDFSSASLLLVDWDRPRIRNPFLPFNFELPLDLPFPSGSLLGALRSFRRVSLQNLSHLCSFGNHEDFRNFPSLPQGHRPIDVFIAFLFSFLASQQNSRRLRSLLKTTHFQNLLILQGIFPHSLLPLGWKPFLTVEPLFFFIPGSNVQRAPSGAPFLSWQSES